MTNEIWKEIPNTGGRYSISILGRIRSHDATYIRANNGHEQLVHKKGKILKPTLGKNGYYYVSLRRNNGKKKYYIHRLMLETFVSDEPNLEVNHKSGVRTDNRLSNLEWVTGKGNMQHCVYTLGHTGRLTAPMRRVRCVESKTVYPSIALAARSAGVSYKVMVAACNGQKPINGTYWRFVDGPAESSEMIELNKRKVECIETGDVYESLTEAAEDVGRCISAISQALSGKSHSCAGCHWRYADGSTD